MQIAECYVLLEVISQIIFFLLKEACHKQRLKFKKNAMFCINFSPGLFVTNIFGQV